MAPIPLVPARARARRPRRRRRLPAWAGGLAPAEPPARATPRPRRSARTTRGPGALAAGRRAAASAAIRRGELDPPAAAAAARHRARPSAPAAARAPAGARARPHRRPARRDGRRGAWPCWTTRASPPCSGPGSRAEVAIAGAAPRLPPGLAISGRIDRLVVEPDRVLVADFKTNRPAPDAHRGRRPRLPAPDGDLCRGAAARSSPAGAIEAALVWTDGPKLMPIPENLLRASPGRAGPDG